MLPEVHVEVQRCAAEIQKISPGARVVVFGSAIEESVKNPRDIDLLVVLPDGADFKLMRRKILTIPRTIWPLDIVVIPIDFLNEKLRMSGNFYAFICEEGVEIGSQQKVRA